MQIEPVPPGHGGDGGDIVGAADAGAADAGDDAGRQQPGRPVGDDRRLERGGIHAAQRPVPAIWTRLSSPMPDTQIARSIEVCT